MLSTVAGPSEISVNIIKIVICYQKQISEITVSISGLDPDSPQPQPWQSKIVTGNKDNELYSQQLFYSARAGGLSCLVKDQISILYS